MIIEPMDDFWKQMLDELEKTTSEEWMQLIEDYERENHRCYVLMILPS